MSQTIVTTTEDLSAILRGILTPCLPALPPEVVELETLKRKETLTTEEVEKLYGLKANTLRKQRVTGEGPSYSKVGERVLYTHVAIKKFLDSRRQKTYDQP